MELHQSSTNGFFTDPQLWLTVKYMWEAQRLGHGSRWLCWQFRRQAVIVTTLCTFSKPWSVVKENSHTDEVWKVECSWGLSYGLQYQCPALHLCWKVLEQSSKQAQTFSYTTSMFSAPSSKHKDEVWQRCHSYSRYSSSPELQADRIHQLVC